MSVLEPFCFAGRYSGSMLLAASVDTVTEYLQNHQGWFCRCADPMQAQPLGLDAYILTIGQYHFLGYDIEPKVGLKLAFQAPQLYRIETALVPDHDPGYAVDFQSDMKLVDTVALTQSIPATLVEWGLSLSVSVHLPQWMNFLPKSMVQSAGSRLLSETVRHVSSRLTQKVQIDFHKMGATRHSP